MAFIFGILATFFAFILEAFVWIFHPDLFAITTPLTQTVLFSILFMAFAEEIARVLFARQYLKMYAKEHPLVAALFFGLGFTLLELVLTYWNGFSFGILGATSFHLLATFLTFWWLQQSRSRSAITSLLFLLTGLHICFNLIVLYWFNS